MYDSPTEHQTLTFFKFVSAKILQSDKQGMGFNEETVPESIHAAGSSRPSRRTGTASSDGPSDSRKMEDPWYRKYVKDTSDQSLCREDFKKISELLMNFLL